MLTTLQISSVYVLDQDEALAFYVGKLGLEVKTDVDLGFMRWLTVGVPGDDREVLLEVPGPPQLDDATAAQVRDLVTKGATAGNLFFTTADARGTFDALTAAGDIDVTDEPTERPYGIDFGLRDPFGNAVRVSQPTGASGQGS